MRKKMNLPRMFETFLKFSGLFGSSGLTKKKIIQGKNGAGFKILNQTLVRCGFAIQSAQILTWRYFHLDKDNFFSFHF